MPRSSSARIAFVGAGEHATESLYPNIAHIPEFDLVAVCDLDPGRADSAARRFGAPASFTDLDRMLQQEAPDGVCICGPPQMHYELGLDCLGRGLSVFMEKPPAPDYAKAIELAGAADRNQTFGMVGFMKRFAPANVVAAEHMRTESFGRLSSISLVHGSGPYADPYDMMIYNGIHMVDLARHFGGGVDVLSALTVPDGHPTRAIVVNFRFANGAVGSLNMNSGHHWRDCFEQVYISGTGSALLIDASRSVEVMSEDRRFADARDVALFGWSSRYYVSGNMAGWEAGGHYTRGYWGELSHFAKACVGLVEPTPTLQDGARAMQVVEAVISSMQEGGRPVQLPGLASRLERPE